MYFTICLLLTLMLVIVTGIFMFIANYVPPVYIVAVIIVAYLLTKKLRGTL